MSQESQVRLLSTVDILEPLSKEELERLVQRHPDVLLEEGAFLYTPGDHSERLFILKQGRVRIYKAMEERELTLATATEETVFGEMSLTNQRLEGAYARATEPSVVLAMNCQDLERLMLEKPRVRLHVVHLLSERLRVYEDRLSHLALRHVPERLANLLLLLCESEGVTTSGKHIKTPTHYTHVQLGDMIGANRVSVTRAFAHLQDEEAVELRRRRIYLKDLEALRRIAEGSSGKEE